MPGTTKGEVFMEHFNELGVDMSWEIATTAASHRGKCAREGAVKTDSSCLKPLLLISGETSKCANEYAAALQRKNYNKEYFLKKCIK